MAKHRPPYCIHLIFARFVGDDAKVLFLSLYLVNRGADHQRLSAIPSARSTDPPFSDINDSRRHTCIPKSGQRIFQVRQARAEKQWQEEISRNVILLRIESGHCSSLNLLRRTLICSLPAYSLGKEEEWYALPPPAAGRIIGPSSLSSRFYKHHHRRNHNRFSFRCGGTGKVWVWFLLSRKMVSAMLPRHS